MEKAIEIILQVGGIVGALMAIGTFLVLVVKPLRIKLIKTFGSNKAQLAVLRDGITDIYYKYLYDKRIPRYKKESLVYMYEAYSESGGNSYISNIYEDMKLWDVYIPDAEVAYGGFKDKSAL